MNQPDPRPVVVALGDQPADAALAFAVDEARVLADVRRFVDAYVATHPPSANRVRFLEYDSL